MNTACGKTIVYGIREIGAAGLNISRTLAQNSCSTGLEITQTRRHNRLYRTRHYLRVLGSLLSTTAKMETDGLSQALSSMSPTDQKEVLQLAQHTQQQQQVNECECIHWTSATLVLPVMFKLTPRVQ